MTAYSKALTDYLGEGLAVGRPVSLYIPPTSLGLYWATDTNVLSAWSGSGWVALPTGTVTQIVAGAGLAGGTITSAGTVSLGTIVAGGLMGNAGTAAAVPAGVAVGAGLSLSAAGTLAAEWNTGTVTTLGTVVGGATLALSGGVLSVLTPAVGGDITNNVTATGSSQATALQLASGLNIVTAGSAGTGVELLQLVSADVGGFQSVFNADTIAHLAYPYLGQEIGNLGTNAPYTVPPGARALFMSLDGSRWAGTSVPPDINTGQILGNAGTAAGVASGLNLGTVANGVTLAISGTTLNATLGVLGYGNLPASANIRTLAFSLIGGPPSGQPFFLPLSQAGTLLANGGTMAVTPGTAPTATETLTVGLMHLGTVTTLGTILVNTGGTVTGPTYADTPNAAGDSAVITNQAAADSTFANWGFGLQWRVM